MKKDLNIIIFGAGAVGASVGGWIASEYNNIFFYDKGEVADILESKGITHYLGEEKDKTQRAALSRLYLFSFFSLSNNPGSRNMR